MEDLREKEVTALKVERVKLLRKILRADQRANSLEAIGLLLRSQADDIGCRLERTAENVERQSVEFKEEANRDRLELQQKTDRLLALTSQLDPSGERFGRFMSSEELAGPPSG